MAGFDVVLGVDIGEVALRSYKANHPEIETWQIDILDLTAKELPYADVILGSTPCVEFSIAKRNRTYDMSLTNHFLKIVRDYQPQYWMLENVPGIAPFLNVPYKILNAADYGVPQKRKRCIAGKYPLPTPTHSEHGNQTLNNARLRPWIRFGEIKYADATTVISKKGISSAFRRANEMGRKNCAFMPQFIDDHDVLPTITSSECHGLRASCPIIYEEGKLRRLSFRECQRAQSFPDDYIFKGNQAQRYHQLGDAVPPLLAKSIALEIRDNRF